MSATADGEVKPGKATLAVVFEFGMRWSCPRDVDPDRYDAKLRLLARDCAEMAPGLLRKAGDRIARIPGRFNVLPTASELIQAANEIIAERAAAQEAEKRAEAAERGRPMPQPGDKTAAYAAANKRALQAGMRVMQTDDGETFRLGDPGERRGVRRDGSAIVPWFHRNDGPADAVLTGWYCRKDDADVLAACHRHYGAAFTIRGCQIIPITQKANQ